MADSPKSKTQQPTPSDASEPRAGSDPPETGRTLQGWQAPLQNDEQVRYALDQAFDYRGDVTVRTTDGRTVEGYVYDRQQKAEGVTIRIMPNDGSGRLSLDQSRICGLAFTGKDTAEGRSFEAWIQKYAQKKKAGQEASIYGESAS